MSVCDAIIVSTISRMFRAVAAVRYFYTLVGDLEHVCVASESCQIFPRDKNPDYKM